MFVQKNKTCRHRAGKQTAVTAVGVDLYHPFCFWSGVLMLITGVLLHLPDFISMESMGYRMSGMPMSEVMLWGMVLILLGLPLSTYGLLPRLSTLFDYRTKNIAAYQIRAMDDAKLTSAHWWLLFVLGAALVVDIMKPATLGFVVPGMRDEYGLTMTHVSLFPLSALTGTTLGSVLWGWLSDRLGRRATILLASLFFVATSICGFMPSFGWQIFMCFVMGLSAGGMLPIVYALMAESVPAKKRGWLVILHGGLASTCGYLAASGLATLFEPEFTWRILWFFNLPTGLLIIVMNRWIPESPRFLLENGRAEAARFVLHKFGVVLETQARAFPRGPWTKPESGHDRRAWKLFKPPFLKHSVSLILYGLSWGLVNWGFLTFMPTMLRDAGFGIGSGSALLFYASLVALPGTCLVAFLYGKWSSKKTMILFAFMTSLVLVGFASISADLKAVDSGFIVALLVSLMMSSNGVITMLLPYAAEVFPTDLRGTGSGIAAAASKAGGMVGPPAMGLLLANSAGFAIPALAVAAPIALAASLLVFTGIETRGRGLECLSAMGEGSTGP
ncbi:MAG: MFS transporter [Methylococcaceae bacterium]|nr:MFS transporter [Methylococcaceae bacterium]